MLCGNAFKPNRHSLRLHFLYYFNKYMFLKVTHTHSHYCHGASLTQQHHVPYLMLCVHNSICGNCEKVLDPRTISPKQCAGTFIIVNQLTQKNMVEANNGYMLVKSTHMQRLFGRFFSFAGFYSIRGTRAKICVAQSDERAKYMV